MPVTFVAGLLCQQSVVLDTPVPRGEDPFFVSPAHVQVAAVDDEFVTKRRRLCDHFARRGDDHAAADLLDALFDSGLGGGDNPHPVLIRAGLQAELMMEVGQPIGLWVLREVPRRVVAQQHQLAALQADRLADFHHQLSLQAGSYQNGMWVVATAKAGVEEGVEQIGGSMIVAPSGEVVAQAATLGDELVIHRCDLDLCRTYKEGVFPARNRRVEHYGLLTQSPGRK